MAHMVRLSWWRHVPCDHLIPMHEVAPGMRSEWCASLCSLQGHLVLLLHRSWRWTGSNHCQSQFSVQPWNWYVRVIGKNGERISLLAHCQTLDLALALMTVCWNLCVACVKYYNEVIILDRTWFKYVHRDNRPLYWSFMCTRVMCCEWFTWPAHTHTISVIGSIVICCPCKLRL